VVPQAGDEELYHVVGAGVDDDAALARPLGVARFGRGFPDRRAMARSGCRTTACTTVSQLPYSQAMASRIRTMPGMPPPYRAVVAMFRKASSVIHQGELMFLTVPALEWPMRKMVWPRSSV
jgi:hypothetical protein